MSENSCGCSNAKNQEENDIKLQKILSALSTVSIANDPVLKVNTIRDFKEIYESDYRHSYSKCFDTVSKIYGKEQECATILVQNLKLILDSNEIISDKKIHMKLMKLNDHISLDYNRLNFFNNYSNSVLKKIEEADDNIGRACDKVEDVEHNIANIRAEMNNHKFDVMGITTLVLTAFTLISVNGVVFSGIVAKDIKLNLVILTFGLLNAMLLCSIYCIYTIVRKIHGMATMKEVYWTLTVMIVLLVTGGILGYNCIS